MPCLLATRTKRRTNLRKLPRSQSSVSEFVHIVYYLFVVFVHSLSDPLPIFILFIGLNCDRILNTFTNISLQR